MVKRIGPLHDHGVRIIGGGGRAVSTKRTAADSLEDPVLDDYNALAARTDIKSYERDLRLFLHDGNPNKDDLSPFEIRLLVRKYFEILEYERSRANPNGMPEEQKDKRAHNVDVIFQLLGDSSEETWRRLLGAAQREVAARKEVEQHIPALPTKEGIKRYDQRRKYPGLANLGIIEFLKAQWAPWILPKAPAVLLQLELRDQLFTRAKLRELDGSAERALANWLSKSENVLPDEVYLPTIEDALTAILDFDPGAACSSYRLARAAGNRILKQKQQPSGL